MQVLSPFPICWINLFYAFLFRRKSGQSSSRQHASRPEASPLDFVIRPQSKIDPEQIRARAKQAVQDQRRLKVFLSSSKLFSFVCLLSADLGSAIPVNWWNGTKQQWLFFVGILDEQEIAAVEGAQEEKSSGVKAQCGRPWDDQVPVESTLASTEQHYPCTRWLCLQGWSTPYHYQLGALLGSFIQVFFLPGLVGCSKWVQKLCCGGIYHECACI